MNINEFGITKIMDGIFISDLSLLKVFLLSLRTNDFLLATKSPTLSYGLTPQIRSTSMNRISNSSTSRDMDLTACCLGQINWSKCKILSNNQRSNFCVVSFAVIFSLKLPWFYPLISLKYP